MSRVGSGRCPGSSTAPNRYSKEPLSIVGERTSHTDDLIELRPERYFCLAVSLQNSSRSMFIISNIVLLFQAIIRMILLILPPQLAIDEIALLLKFHLSECVTLTFK